MKTQLFKGFFAFLLLITGFAVAAQRRRDVPYSIYSGEGRLEKIRFNLYADSIKPVLNYYVNVEGTFASGRVLPLDTNIITLTADWGVMAGNEWVVPKRIEGEKVTFRAIAKDRSDLAQTVTVYLKKVKDPQDEVREMDMPEVPKRFRR